MKCGLSQLPVATVTLTARCDVRTTLPVSELLCKNCCVWQNSLLPPSQRCRNQTDKEPTGPFNRQKLLEFLEKKAKTEKDWEQNKPYVKEQKGAL